MTNFTNVVKLLSGAWLYLNQTSIKNGTIQPPGATGPPSFGMIIYHPLGYMSANIMSSRPQDRPANITYPPTAADREVDWAQIGRHTMSYAGPFSITEGDEKSGVMIHGPLTFAAVPGWVGSPQRREYEFFEDNNVLNLRTWNETTKSRGTLFWRRLGSSWGA